MTKNALALSATTVAIFAGSAFAAPANDNRANATVLGFPTLGVAGTTTAATIEPAWGTGSCANSQSNPDVWYFFTSPGGSIRFDLCGATYDSVIEVYVGSGGNLGASIGCDDDACGNLHSLLTRGTVAGTGYFIRVSGYNGTNTGNFTLAVTAGDVIPPPPPAEITQPSLGPDVTIGNLYDVGAYGSTSINGVAYSSFAVGTDSWNIGDRQAVWVSGNNQHPVIGQQMYKLKNGRFEQLGLSWVKHGFFATNSAAFEDFMAYPSDTNRACVPSTVGGSALGVNCSDLYGSGLNGGRSYLGPRYDINPINGSFTFPWQPLVNNYTPSDSTDKVSRRIMVKNSDLGDTAARYFVDSVYITPDDAQWGNGRNNFTTREITVPTATATAPTFLTPDIRRKAAIEVWATVDPTVTVVPVDFTEIVTSVNDTLATPPGPRTINVQGRFFVASKVTNNGNGTWNYEYAIQNINSHRGVGKVAIPASGNAGLTGAASVAPMYHSGDRVTNNPWIGASGPGYLGWTTDPNFSTTTTIPGAPVASQTVTGVGANFIRWGAMHNYRFTSSKAPVTGSIKLGLSRAPANTQGFQGSTLVAAGLQVPTPCVGDIAGPGQAVGGDGELTADDIIVFLNAFFAGDLYAADVAGAGQATIPDLDLTADDIIVFLNGFFAGC